MLSRLTRMQGKKSRRETTLTGMLSTTGIRLNKLNTTEPYCREHRRMTLADGMMHKRRPGVEMIRSMTHVGEGTDRLSETQEEPTMLTEDRDSQSSNVGKTVSLQRSNTSRTGWQDINH